MAGKNLTSYTDVIGLYEKAQGLFLRATNQKTKNFVLRAASPLLHASSPFLTSRRKANVAMFHIGRVGSSVVAEMLDQHSKMDWAREFYHPDNMWRTYLPQKNPIRRLRIRMALSGPKIFGFETKYQRGGDLQRIGMTLDSYCEKLSDIGFGHFVLLERRNLLRRYVSFMVGEKRGKWHNRGEKQTLTQIKVDPESIDKKGTSLPCHFANMERDKLSLLDSMSGRNLLRLTYEEDIRYNPKNAYRKMCSFLEIEDEPADVSIKKSNPFPLREIVTNYQDVAANLEGSEYEWMLDC